MAKKTTRAISGAGNHPRGVWVVRTTVRCRLPGDLTTACPQRALFRRALRLALAVCALAVVVGFPRFAHAAVAGMCDENAQSIAAPLQLVPSHNGEARGCETDKSDGLGNAPAPAPSQQISAAPVFDRAPPATFAWSFRSRGDRIAAPEVVRAPTRPGFGAEIFRPPRG